MKAKLTELLDTIGQTMEHPAFGMFVRCSLSFWTFVVGHELLKLKSNEPSFEISLFNWFIIIAGGLVQVFIVINSTMSGSWSRYFDAKRSNGNGTTNETTPTNTVPAGPGG